MRLTLTVCRHGLSVAAAVALLTACGSSGNDNSASSSSAASSSASETSANAAGSKFCTQAAAALSSVSPALSGTENDPAALAQALQQAADKVRAIHPPSEISSDWTKLSDGIQQFAQAFASANVNDPASASALQQRSAQIIGSLTAAANHVQTYLSDRCGLTAPSESATPTS
jgi:hypothetical protein